MKIIHGKRGTGKTTELIKQSSLKKIPILCSTFNQARLISHKAAEARIKIPEPICVSALNNQIYCGSFNFNNVLIDEIDYVLQSLLSNVSSNKINSIDAVTTSSDIQELEYNDKDKYVSQSEKNFKDIIGKKYMITFRAEAGFNKTIKGYCENFAPDGTTAFYDDEEGFYIISVKNIIEMRPIKLNIVYIKEDTENPFNW